MQRPIPIWIGGLATKAVMRAAAIGDGWLPLGSMDSEMYERMELYHSTLQSVGKSDRGRVMGRVNPWASTHAAARSELRDWVGAGATHIAIGSSNNVFESSDQYFSDLERFVSYVRK
jgi:alkanesulfonate monooxygenase SsuD/methylene tetrahydromethanopterin reductase-like flavin-dependent oxidoreductase (luciferase family)